MNYNKKFFLSLILITGLASTTMIQATFNADVNALVHEFMDKKIKGPEFIRQLKSLCERHKTLDDMKNIVDEVQKQLNNLAQLGNLLAKLQTKLAEKIGPEAQQKVEKFAKTVKENPVVTYYTYFC